MSVIRCPSCNKQINDTEKICPECGHVLNKDLSSLFWMSVSAICAGVVLMFLNLGGDTYSTSYSDTPVSYASMDVLEHKWCRDKWGEETICGIIHNNMGRTCSFAEIHINLYDNAGVQTDTTSAYTTNLESGVKWKFEAKLYGKKAANYKIVKVDCTGR